MKRPSRDGPSVSCQGEGQHGHVSLRRGETAVALRHHPHCSCQSRSRDVQGTRDTGLLKGGSPNGKLSGADLRKTNLSKASLAVEPTSAKPNSPSTAAAVGGVVNSIMARSHTGNSSRPSVISGGRFGFVGRPSRTAEPQQPAQQTEKATTCERHVIEKAHQALPRNHARP